MIKYKRYLKKLKNDTLKFFENNSEEYLEFVNENIEDRSISLCSIKIYDVLDNSGMNKLLKALYKLDRNKFKYETYLKKNTLGDIKYVKLEIDNNNMGGWTRLGEIECEEDSNIKTITILYTQIDNQNFIIEYEFNLKRVFDSYQMKNMFIRKHLKEAIKSIKSFPLYKIKEIEKMKGFKNIYYIEQRYFLYMFQSYITRYFYTEKGKEYQLPIITCSRYNSKYLSENNIKNSFLTSVYHEKDKNIFWLKKKTHDEEGVVLKVYFNDKTMPYVSLISKFKKYGNGLYYNLFNNIEKEELNKKLSKYFTSIKTKVKKEDYLWLINKIKCIEENKNKYLREIEEFYNYELYRNGKLLEIDKKNFEDDVEKYFYLYKQYFEYINTLYLSQYNSTILNITSITLIITIIGIFISIFCK